MKKRPVCLRRDSTKFPHEFFSIDFAKPHCLLVLRGRNVTGRPVLTEPTSEIPTFTGTEKECQSTWLWDHTMIYTWPWGAGQTKSRWIGSFTSHSQCNIKSVRRQGWLLKCDSHLSSLTASKPQKNAYLLNHVGHLLSRCIHRNFDAFVTCSKCLL
jgi:hypothetical protein